MSVQHNYKKKNGWNNASNGRANSIDNHDNNKSSEKHNQQSKKIKKTLNHIQFLSDHEPFILNKGCFLQQNKLQASDKFSFENWRSNLYEKVLVNYGRIGQELLGTVYPDPVVPDEPQFPNALSQVTKELRVKVYLQEYSDAIKKREEIADNRVKIVAEINKHICDELREDLDAWFPDRFSQPNIIGIMNRIETAHNQITINGRSEDMPGTTSKA